MIFKKLKLRNFKSHKNTEIEFDKGITVIVGENGAGKSSILEGISFALFKFHSSQKIDNLVQNNSNKMEVELEFFHEGNDYKIVRIKTKGIKSSLFKKEGDNYSLLYQGENDVQNAIQKILNMDSALFSNAVYVRQGDIAELVSKTVSQKKSFISKLLGIDSLEKSWKEIGSLITEYEKKLAEYKGHISGFPDFENFFLDETEKLKKLQESNILINKELDKFNKDKKSLKEEKEKQEEIFSKRKTLRDSLYKIIPEINSLKKSEEELTKVLSKSKKAHERIKELEKEMDSLKDYYNFIDIFNDLNLLEKECETLTDFLVEKKKAEEHEFEECKKIWKELGMSDSFERDTNFKDYRDTKRKDLALDIEMIDELKNKIAVLEHQINDIKSSKDNLLDIEGECPICKTKINEEKKSFVVEEYDKKIREYKEELSGYKEDIEKANDFYKSDNKILECLHNLEIHSNKREEIFEEFAAKKNKLDGIVLDITEVRKKVKGITFEEVKEKIELHEDLEKEVATLKGSLENEEYFNEQLSTTKKVINELKIQSDSIEKELRGLEFDEEYYNYVISEHKNVLDGIESLTKQKYDTIGKARSNIHYIKRMLQEKEVHSKCVYNYKTLLEYTDLLKKIRALYSKDGIQKELRNISRPLIERYTKQFFNEFNFNYSDLSIDEDYNIDVYGSEGKSSLNMISGGEKIAIALALRLGITKAISNNGVETILLDEPTIHLDSSRVNELINLFEGLSVLPQMIIVTHESELENVADNFVTIEKQNGVSIVIK